MIFLILLPFICVVGVWLFIKGKSKIHKGLGVVSIGITFCLGVFFTFGFHTQTSSSVSNANNISDAPIHLEYDNVSEYQHHHKKK